MKINRITAKNFRTLKDIELDIDGSYCTLSGKNNSGKSAFVKIISFFLQEEENFYFSDQNPIRYKTDTTQWEKGEIEISLEITIYPDDDSELYYFVGRISQTPLEEEPAIVIFKSKFDENKTSNTVSLNGKVLEDLDSVEIIKKFRSAQNLIMHNSTNPRSRMYYSGDDIVEIIEANFSDDDNKKINDAKTRLQNQFKKAAQRHKTALSEHLGRLKDRLEVELSPPEQFGKNNIPLSIKLTDKSVEVPIREWGAGTQNRTRALISVFSAARARATTDRSDRVTPVVIIEEPESFLHPSAQAEFGKILNQMSTELKIQIIATTHSPYMLNQVNPSANILLDRKTFRGLPKETYRIDTSEKNWMRPFSENLGIIPEDFASLASIFTKEASLAVLVEGPIDKEYFDHLRDQKEFKSILPEAVEFIPYGGKDTLKNSTLIKFVISRFERVFITFDLDAFDSCSTALKRIGLSPDVDFCAIGIAKPGCDCVEGLTPASVRSAVYSENPDLVMALASDGAGKKHAKNELKKLTLEKFKVTSLSKEEYQPFLKLFKEIGKRFYD